MEGGWWGWWADGSGAVGTAAGLEKVLGKHFPGRGPETNPLKVFVLKPENKIRRLGMQGLVW